VPPGRFEAGSGPRLVVVPGIQGRWEWMASPLGKLATTCRVTSYSLCGEPGSGMPFEAAAGFDAFVRQLESLVGDPPGGRVALCGVSYGGFVALRYAARHPERVSALILVSTPPPGWRPSETQQRHLANPRLSMPAFAVGAAGRLWHEVRCAVPDWRGRMRFTARQAVQVLRAPMVPSAAAARMAVQQADDFEPDCAAVRAPTLVVTGDDDLDRVVPPPATRQYLTRIAGATSARLNRTGHCGLLLQPERFARLVSDFVHAHDH
jgi:pimeloyl-ACP methyl ester carboxylesterase